MVESNGPKIVIALWAMSAISFLFIALRFFCKARHTNRLGTDDAILAIAWVFALIYAAFMTESVRWGLGKHSTNIDAADKIPMYKNLFVGEFFALIAIPTSKTSFAVTLLRLVAKNWQKWFIWFVIISMNVVLWLCGILLFIQCKPIEKNWRKDMPGTCWNSDIQDNYSVFAGAYSAFLDVVLATFPCVIIWNLQMGKREKVGVISAMSLGFLAGITAAVKTSFLPGAGNWKDPIYSLADLLIWSHAETAVTIVASCIPFFRVLIKNTTSKGSKPYRHSYRLESFHNTGRRQKHHGSVDVGDDMSETSILRNAVQGGAIVKMNEISVEYHVEKPTKA
ncbi:hypothetical protein CC78DRAFT_147847 [Lojkania enalia]|uniref:Rhodopsin domain-containing protein n=1 Tax=Lojkania enalia TaxID=147567 RepID=A0A9P4KHC4_9PLEO|nr:hypothetical protein CC78DRAFT_147847 [Didymosphaeria enalia]